MGDQDQEYQTSYVQEVSPTGELDLLINRNYVTTTSDCNTNHADVLHESLDNISY